uniref:Alpha-galactosidase n=1 Tax=Panagrellus redivivus TaxID=6233 RepID=A0A7E4VWQ4_PANRE
MYSAIALVFGSLISAVISLDNGLVRTPPMGWMSWTKYYCETDCVKYPDACINENLYAAQADRLAEDGYLDVGYEYVHIDDCWMSYNRTFDGQLAANSSRFSHGIPWLANYVHKRGLKFAIYEDYGTKTCGGYPGSLGFLKVDADTFASWGVDYLKLDGCNVNLDQMKYGYPEMERHLNATGRPIVYACSWPAYLIDQQDKVNYTEIGNSCNLWRNFDDISMSWRSIVSIIDWYVKFQDKLAAGQKPGAWNDPDMIIAGNNEISDDQARAQMTIWSIWSAPLIMSNDLRSITPSQKKILQNRDVIAIDQDPLGKFGKMIASTADIQLFVKQVTPLDQLTGEPSYAIAALNRATYPVNVTIEPWRLGLQNPSGYSLKDLWTGQFKGDITSVDARIHFDIVPPTGVAFYKATIL